jgi:two-component system, sensor histidine kinase and response regulator
MEKRDMSIKPFKIMIVDDDPLVVLTLERLLFKKNYLFFSVNSGEEALKSVLENEPDMILLDVFMKELSGFEVCNKLKQMGITARIPVIFLTSNNATSEIVKGFQVGAVDYIIKPFNTEELLARLSTHLELKRIREEIRLMTLIKTRFFSIMTHDIMNYLTGVKGVSEFLNQELAMDPINMEEIKKLSVLLLDDSTQLYHFVGNLLKWDRLETGTDLIKYQNVILKPLIQEVTQRLSTSIHQKNLNLVLNMDDNFQTNSAPDILKNIFTELIGNAVKYSNTDGKVVVSCLPKTETWILKVEDFGVGMDKEVSENIFKLDTPHPKTIGTGNEKGIGLGLIICQSMVRNLNGKITLASEKHKGTQVTVELPVVD